jgi:two-component system, cell cycle response regulator DivK
MKKTILIIEDDIATIDIYKTILEKADFEIEVIRWGEEALKKVEKIKNGKAKKPDLVLIDLILPDISGMNVLEEMKKNKQTKDIPAFVLTNYADPKMEKRENSLKGDGYFLKTSYTPRKLVQLVKRKIKK